MPTRPKSCSATSPNVSNPVPKFQKGHKKPEGSGRKAGQVNLELGVEPTTYTGQ